jgi:hypothetical protein
MMKFFSKYALGIGVLAYWFWDFDLFVRYLSFQPSSSGF